MMTYFGAKVQIQSHFHFLSFQGYKMKVVVYMTTPPTPKGSLLYTTEHTLWWASFFSCLVGSNLSTSHFTPTKVIPKDTTSPPAVTNSFVRISFLVKCGTLATWSFITTAFCDSKGFSFTVGMISDKIFLIPSMPWEIHGRGHLD